jgi:hypothetical protein
MGLRNPQNATRTEGAGKITNPQWNRRWYLKKFPVMGDFQYDGAPAPLAGLDWLQRQKTGWREEENRVA